LGEGGGVGVEVGEGSSFLVKKKGIHETKGYLMRGC